MDAPGDPKPSDQQGDEPAHGEDFADRLREIADREKAGKELAADLEGDAFIRAVESLEPVPEFDSTPFTAPPPLEQARVAIVTTAGLRSPDQEGFGLLDQSFRILGATTEDLFLDHMSTNFDRTGWLTDPNVVFPIDRLNELEEQGKIGSVGPRHLSFLGAQLETMTTIKLDSGPAAAELLREDGVDVVLLTPI